MRFLGCRNTVYTLCAILPSDKNHQCSIPSVHVEECGFTSSHTIIIIIVVTTIYIVQVTLYIVVRIVSVLELISSKNHLLLEPIPI